MPDDEDIIEETFTEGQGEDADPVLPDEEQRADPVLDPDPLDPPPDPVLERLDDLEMRLEDLQRPIDEGVVALDIPPEIDREIPPVLVGDGGVETWDTPAGQVVGQADDLMDPSMSEAVEGGFWAKITGNTSLGGSQWTYSWSEVFKDTTGYTGWATKSGGLSGTDNAYNSMEDINSGVGAGGTYGNGVPFNDLDTADWTFALQPITTNNIVFLRPATQETTDSETGVVTTTIEYWFTASNGVSGSCD